MNKLNVRVAGDKDIDALANLRVEFCKYEKRFDPKVKYNSEAAFVFKREIREALSIKAKQNFYWILENENKILGYLSVHLYPDLPGIAFLGEMFIEKKLRGRGLGKKLLDKAKEFLISLGISEIRLSTYSENKAAIDFFESMDFSTEPHKTILMSLSPKP